MRGKDHYCIKHNYTSPASLPRCRRQLPSLCFCLQTKLLSCTFVNSTCPKSFHSPTSSPLKPLVVKCGSNSEEQVSNDLKDALSGTVDKQVEPLRSSLLYGLENASQRVEMAKREPAEIERQELEAQLLRNYINQLESRASSLILPI